MNIILENIQKSNKIKKRDNLKIIKNLKKIIINFPKLNQNGMRMQIFLIK